MAKVQLRPEIASISGRVGNVIYKTYKSGAVHVYQVPEYKRKKPISEAEMQARVLMVRRQLRVSELMRGGMSRQEAWSQVKQEIPSKTPREYPEKGTV